MQTTDGNYEANLTKDQESTRPIQKQLKLTRYRVSKPPGYIHNVPKYITAETMRTSQVLKIDINTPHSRSSELWGGARNGQTTHDASQECIFGDNLQKTEPP